jgi:hypothetical protein
VVRGRPGPTPRDRELSKQFRQRRRIVGLARSERYDQRKGCRQPRAWVLIRQAAAGPSDGVIGWLVATGRILVIRACPPVWELGPIGDLAAVAPCW